jgi:pilus assembly protein CpaB
MGRRTVLLISSVLIAAVGTALVALYVRGADSRAQAGAASVKVYVANDPIQAGTTAKAMVDESGLLKLETMPARLVPPDAVRDVDTLTSLGSKPLTRAVLADEPLRAAMFGTTAGAQIAAKGMAVSIQLSDAARIPAVLDSGAYVAVFATVTEGAPKTQLLLPKVQVLAVGNDIVPGSAALANGKKATQRSSAAVPASIITLDVDQKDAEKLIYASSTGKELYFALLNGDQKEASPSGGGTDEGNLFG